MNASWNIGDQVTAAYKTGEYIGEIVELRPDKAAIRVMAVERHPDQGNLHHPDKAAVPMFHQRRALAEHEIAWMPLATVTRYEGTMPDYRESLRASLDRQIRSMRQAAALAERHLMELEALERDYFPKRDREDLDE